MTRPDRQPAVQVQLSVRPARTAIELYKAAFEAEEVYRFGGTDGHEDVVYGHRWEVGRPLGPWPPAEGGKRL